MFAPILSSCGLLPPLTPPPAALEISDPVPTGCGTKVTNFQTISWSVKFTASGGPAGAEYQWFFSDGTTATGQTVIANFETGEKEAANPSATGEHEQVNFDITVTAGGESVTKTVGIPARGDLDGGPDPFGDTCVPDEGRTHVPTGTVLCYVANPPASGPHYNAGNNVAPVHPGFYDEALATARWVHNLEHGTVVLLYDCGGTCSDELKAQLKALFDLVPEEPIFHQKKMVITRYNGVNGICTGTATFPGSGPFLAIAWDVQRPFETLDTAGILDFYARRVNHGPENAPIPAQ